MGFSNSHGQSRCSEGRSRGLLALLTAVCCTNFVPSALTFTTCTSHRQLRTARRSQMADQRDGAVVSYASVAEFMHDAEFVFKDREAEHSVMLGVLGNLQKDMNFYNVKPQLLAVTAGSAPVLLASMVYPYPLVLSLVSPGSSDADVHLALRSLAHHASSVLKEEKVFPVKVVGHPELVNPLIALLAESCPGVGLKPGVSMQFYRLDPQTFVAPRLKLEDDPSLTTRHYDPEKDAGWIRQWIHAFHMDVFGYPQDQMVENQLSELARLPRDARGMLLLFRGDDFVSYAGYGGQTANTMRITGVFTPEAFRGKGYGQLACWCACRFLLTPVADGGLGRTAVAIAADKAKSSVMGIYKRLGFAETTEFQEYVDHDGFVAATKRPENA